MKKLLLIVFTLIMTTISTIPAEAASHHLEFTPEKIYYTDNNTLAIKGMLWNPHEFVAFVPKVDIELRLQTERGPKIIKQSFTNIEVMLDRNGYTSYTFYIKNVEQTDLSHSKLKTWFY